MTVKRNLARAGTNAADLLDDIVDGQKYLLGLNLGVLSNVSDTAGAITGDLDEDSGFSNGTLKNGARVYVPAPSACNGPSTLNIESAGTISIKDHAGDALAQNAWASGDLLEFIYDGSVWRLISVVTPAQTAAVADQFPFLYCFDADGTLDFDEDDTEAFIVALGAAGSGAVADYSNARAQGGSAGAVATKRVSVSSSTSLTVTVGEGGASKSSTGGLDGEDGGATSVSDGGSINMIANGGKGGTQASYSAIAKKTAATASGGDHNFDGGVAGAISEGSGEWATGGAAPGFWQDGIDSGDATQRDKPTGGAGLGAPSADNSATGGVAPVGIDVFLGLILLANSAGGDASLVSGVAAGDGGPYAGGGAAVTSNDSIAGDGGPGAGGGAAAGSGGTATSGAGGDGRVWVLSTKPATKS